jgi:hypothetical protein
MVFCALLDKYMQLCLMLLILLCMASVGQFHLPLAAFDMNCMVTSPHSEC